MNDRDGFVMYRAYYNALKRIPSPEDRLRLYDAICAYGLDGEQPDLEYPLDAIFVQMQTTCDYATRRYEEAKHGGVKGARSRAKSGNVGGRPKAEVKEEKVREAYNRLGSWKAVAEELKISDKTIRKYRQEWSQSGTEKTEKTTQSI